MSKWFSDVDETEGLEDARKAGFFGACAFGVMLVIGMIFQLTTGTMPGLEPGLDQTGALVGMAVELVIVAIAAWRLKFGKGAFWGAAITLLFVFETVQKVVSGTTNIGWMIAYAAIFLALVNGVRGAWARRKQSEAEVFEST